MVPDAEHAGRWRVFRALAPRDRGRAGRIRADRNDPDLDEGRTPLAALVQRGGDRGDRGASGAGRGSSAPVASLLAAGTARMLRTGHVWRAAGDRGVHEQVVDDGA